MFDILSCCRVRVNQQYTYPKNLYGGIEKKRSAMLVFFISIFLPLTNGIVMFSHIFCQQYCVNAILKEIKKIVTLPIYRL